MKILVTGAAGFIGSHVSHRLLDRGDEVVGIDNLNDYYEVSLKEARLDRLRPRPGFDFVKADLADRKAMEGLFGDHRFDAVLNMAAQAGVRYSVENPHAYTEANLVGFTNLLEACRHQEVGHLVFASSSSVYGANTRYPFSEQHNVDHPVSFYAATKKANEVMAHSYASLYGLPVSGLRFFTVYGPWGRPDMAIFKFTKSILAGEPIDVYNNGEMMRDFTFIDDIVTGVVGVIDRPAEADPSWSGDAPNPATSFAPYRNFNIGNGQPVQLMAFIEAIEKALGRKAEKNFLPMQLGDVRGTHADVDRLHDLMGFRPETDYRVGVKAFVDWYLEYYGA